MIRINLVAKKVIKEHILIQKQTLTLIGAFILAVIISLVWVKSAFANRTRVRVELEIEKTELQRLESVKKKSEEFNKKKTRREEIMQTIQNLQNRRVGPRPFMDYLNVVLPADIWFTRLSEKDLSITISGYTFSSQAVAGLMRSMENSEFFTNVELSEIQRQKVQNEEVKSFTITAKWVIEKLEEKDKKEDKKG